MTKAKNKVKKLTKKILESLKVGQVIHVEYGINESLVSKWANENNREVRTHSNKTLWLKS